MKEKQLYILFIIGIVLTIVVFVWLVFLSISFSGSQPASSIPTITTTPIPTVIPFDKPTAPTLQVNGVSVRNFYNTSNAMNANGDVSFEKNNQFELVYLAPFEEFIIDVRGSPFATTRMQAEQAFLKKLGITQEDACKLNVSLGTPAYINPQEAGRRYELSFCENQ